MDAELIRKQLEIGLITSDILLSGTKLIDESSRNAGDYKDSQYFPFYYHLGKQLKPKSVCQIGTKLGLIGACFLRSCKTVDNWLAMDDDRNFTSNIIESNLKLNTRSESIEYIGLLDIQLLVYEEFDLGFLTENFGEERYLEHLSFLWDYLAPEGLLVADYITEHDVFHEFCRVKNREPTIFDTRYGVGIVQK
jgi:predicted O-methyltransferase YrrM